MLIHVMAYIIRTIVKLFIMDHTLHQNLTDLSSAGSSGRLNFMTWNASGIMSSGSYLGCIWIAFYKGMMLIFVESVSTGSTRRTITLP